MVGEVFNGNPSYVCPYQNNMSGVLNFPTYVQVPAKSHRSVLTYIADTTGSHKHSSLPVEALAILLLVSTT